MNNPINYNIKYLPNIDICDALNNSTLGVLIGIFIGLGTEIIMNKPVFWWISLLFFCAVIFLIIAISLNQKHINYIKNSIANNNERIRETVEQNKKIAYENMPECRKAKNYFIGCIIISGMLIIIAIFLFIYKNGSLKVNNQSNSNINLICPCHNEAVDSHELFNQM